jgi:hypothetical protein
MEEFGDRLRRLVAEAFAQGIVLTVPPAKGDDITIDPPEGQQIFEIAAPIPHMGFSHMCLKSPERVVVKAVVVGDPPRPTELIPSFRMPFPPQPK